MDHELPMANEELLTLIKHRPFDCKRAEEIIKTIGDVNQPVSVRFAEEICGIKSYSTTYLYEACDSDNSEAVKLLFEYGADPNYDNPALTNDCAFFSLIYGSISESEIEESNHERYKIAQLFFKYGADPNITSKDDGKSLYTCALWHVPDDFDTPNGEYENKFFELLSSEKDKADRQHNQE